MQKIVAMQDSGSTGSTESLKSTASSRKPSYWAHMVSHYEKRNASLEQRQIELAERIRLMECAVPSLLMGAMVSMKRTADPVAKLSSSSRTSEQIASNRDEKKSFTNSKDREKHCNLRCNESGGTKMADEKPDLNRFFLNTDLRPK